MIYTFTPNPAVDYYVEVPDLQLGRINRTEKEDFYAAGKGINCSIMLDLLGIESTAVYFSGGFTGKFIDESLKAYPHITSKPIETEGITRVNVKFIGESDLAINAKGASITDQAKETLNRFVDTLKEDDVIIISGSLPGNFPVDDLLEVCRAINRKKTRLVLDVPGLKASDLSDLDIFLIKPNLEEFADFLGEEIDEENYRSFIDRALNGNISNILLSLGKAGSYYGGTCGRYLVRVPAVKAFSTVGAGDSTLAAFTGVFQQTEDIEKALKWGNAAGVARVKYGALDDRRKVEEIVSSIELIKDTKQKGEII